MILWFSLYQPSEKLTDKNRRHNKRNYKMMPNGLRDFLDVIHFLMLVKRSPASVGLTELLVSSRRSFTPALAANRYALGIPWVIVSRVLIGFIPIRL